MGLKRVYSSPIVGYDEETYMQANPDIENGVREGLIESAMEHLVIFGLDEIERGSRPFHKDFPRFDENEYLLVFPSLRLEIERGVYTSAFDHFCKVGYKKILEMKERGAIPIEGYDILTYLDANADIRALVIRGEIPDALEHLLDSGLEEIAEGTRLYHKNLPPFDEKDYIEEFPEAVEAVEEGRFSTLFEHFCKVGYREITIRKRDTLLMPIVGYDIETYIAANPDIKRGVEEGLIESALDHLLLYGIEEIKGGRRRFHKDYEPYDERAYLRNNPDIRELVEKGRMESGWAHFVTAGYREMETGKREKVGFYRFEWSEEKASEYRGIFDERAYLEANEDVVSSIEKGECADAWEHFLKYGMEDVRRGYRTLSPHIPPVSESRYVTLNSDIAAILKEDGDFSPFEHFLFHGVGEILSGAREIPGAVPISYREPLYSEEIEKEMQNFPRVPLISVIMPVYNTDPRYLSAAIESVKRQWYPRWELCIVDDASSRKETIDFLSELDDPAIKLFVREENGNISAASNDALQMASGEYIALMDHDDELTVDALYEVVKAINEENPDFIYSDEDKIEPDGRFSEQHFKADYSPDMFLSQNYISHLAVIRRELVEKVGGWSVGLEGSQDYDLYLKILEHTDKIHHIPKILYHWRKIEGSTAADFSDKGYAQEAGRESLKRAMERRGMEAEVFDGEYDGTYRVKYALRSKPLVSIVIPFKDKAELLDMSIGSILEKSTYLNFEIIGVSNNSEEERTFEAMERLSGLDGRVKFFEHNIPFNYSEINNYAVSELAGGEHVILLNNDIEIISEEWIEAMLEFSQREDVGAVGAKLYYPDERIQHAGVILGLGGVAGHSHKYFPRHDRGYFFRPHIVQNLSAVTAACMMVKRRVYLEAGGMDEENLKVAFNDVDFCLRLREMGYLNVYTPYCEAYHHESLSRGKEDDPKKVERFRKEIEYMKKRHGDILEKGDPYYNINLTLDKEDFSLGRRI